jgi:hypothetical protein
MSAYRGLCPKADGFIDESRLSTDWSRITLGLDRPTPRTRLFGRFEHESSAEIFIQHPLRNQNLNSTPKCHLYMVRSEMRTLPDYLIRSPPVPRFRQRLW